MAPHGDQVDPRTVTPAAYRAVLAAARDRADLVVVDTQIVEDGLDTTGLIDELMVPALRAGGWGLAVADTSAAGLTNTLDRVRAVHRAGVPPDRLMAVLSRVPADFTDGADHRGGRAFRPAHHVPRARPGHPRAAERRSTWGGSNTGTRRSRRCWTGPCCGSPATRRSSPPTPAGRPRGGGCGSGGRR